MARDISGHKEAERVLLRHNEELQRAVAARTHELQTINRDLEENWAVVAEAIQTILRNIEKDRLALALKGASDGLRDMFFSNMSERAGKILREDMEAMGPVRLSEVDEAQTSMVMLAKDLAAKGEIMISDGNGDDELVY